MTDATGPMLAADGTPLKRSLNRALRRQKLRALLLISPLLLFILITFIWPIGQMLFRSVENQIVSDTIPRATAELANWDSTSGEIPDAAVFSALTQDLVQAVERKKHTRLGSRLNYEFSGIASLFRKSGRKVDDVGEIYTDQINAIDPVFKSSEVWAQMLGSESWFSSAASDYVPFVANDTAASNLPRTSDAYASFANTVWDVDQDHPFGQAPWNTVYLAFYEDLSANAAVAFDGPHANLVAQVAAEIGGFETEDLIASYSDMDEDWTDPDVWKTISTYSSAYTNGYFLNSVDLQKSDQGTEWRPDDQRIYLKLLWRTMVMSFAITCSCIVLGYPVAWLLANLPMRTANVLMILVLLPFWTSLLVRTSAWKVLLQQQGVINETLVWLGLVATDDRLALINNVTGTIIAMTHILLPFMILPLYSVMKTIPPTYLRAAKSLGATNWTAFWRVYFPQSVPGIGAGSILVFILAIGYYITPEIVGGTKGVFISNRIAYHISSSLNWGLAAALGTILLAVVLIFYWMYDKIVGIDNVKLGG